MYWRKFCLVTAAALIPASTAFGVDQRHDRSIEAAAARIAASKLGSLRGPIGHDEEPAITRKSQPKPMAPPPKPDPLRISDADDDLTTQDGIDPNFTASIKPAPAKVIWDRFDRYGNPIK